MLSGIGKVVRSHCVFVFILISVTHIYVFCVDVEAVLLKYFY